MSDGEAKLVSRFGLSEWAGSIADLGLVLPIAFALSIYSGYSLSTLLLFWGIVSIILGCVFKIPISVQPLKAMAVVAIALGLSVESLSYAAILYGLILLLLYAFGLIGFLEKLFSPLIIKAIQFGVGLILAKKAVMLALENGFYLAMDHSSLAGFNYLNLVLGICIFLLFYLFAKSGSPQINFLLVLLLMIASLCFLPEPIKANMPGKFLSFEFFTFASLQGFRDFLGLSPGVDSHTSFSVLSALSLLIIPQLPLTCGNAIFAASDCSHKLFGEQARRVNPKRLCLSIALSNIFLGVFGAFPICHGAGGITAHAKFGARTGGASIIVGCLFIVFALFKPFLAFLLYIPVSVLVAMLFVAAFGMMGFIRGLERREDFYLAAGLGLLALFTQNLFLVLLLGLVLEKFLKGRKNDRYQSQI